MKQLLIALKATLVLTLLTGVMYPLLVTGLAKVLFRDKADGSLIQANGRTVGSELIGQRFTKPGYFHGRPSARLGWRGPRRCGNRLGQRPGPALEPRSRRCPGGPRGRRPRHDHRGSPPIGRRPYRGPSDGRPGRAPSQRADVESRAGCRRPPEEMTQLCAAAYPGFRRLSAHRLDALEIGRA